MGSQMTCCDREREAYIYTSEYIYICKARKVGGGETSLLCDPGSEVRFGRGHEQEMGRS